MKTTKEELARINTILQEKIRVLENNSLFTRQKFTNLLDKWVESKNSYATFSESNKEPKPFSWEEIFFKMGELNSDANYSILLIGKQELENEIRLLREDKDKENL